MLIHLKFYKEKLDLERKLAKAKAEAKGLVWSGLVDAKASGIAEAENKDIKAHTDAGTFLSLDYTEADKGYYYGIFYSKSGPDNRIDKSELVKVVTQFGKHTSGGKEYVDRCLQQ